MDTKTTVQTNVPDPTPQETALTQAQLDIANKQLEAISQQSAFQAEQFEQLGPLVSSLESDAAAARARAEELAPIQDELLQLQLDALRSGGEATPDQIANIEAASAAALATGETDIERFRTQSLEALAAELAPALGLRPSDTPILDRGGDVAAESLRQQGNLVSNLQAASANARLNFPLATQQIFGAQNLAQQQLQEARSQFREGLAQAAFQNRLSLTGQTGQLGLNLSSFGPSPNTLNTLTNLRFNSAPTTETSGFGLPGLGALLGGFGAGLTGLGAVLPKPTP